MKKLALLVCISLVILMQFAFNSGKLPDQLADSLRAVYSADPSTWPKPDVEAGIKWEELGKLPPAPIGRDSLQDLVELGKVLFYDPRLSGSNQISCVNCHAPDLNWADGRRVALGHDNSFNSRNTPSLENVWYSKFLFWDGRASNLEEQSDGPISSDIEMHQDLKKLPGELKRIKGYAPLFTKAFGDKNITSKRIANALATYQMTFTSRKSDFDYFMEGNPQRLTDNQLKGLHLFRTKGKCMNCHYGPMFTDNDFHNLGLSYYGRDKYEDFGRYNVTKKPEDMGKFKTPGLRNVMRTRPWFHNGLFDNMEGVLNMYNAGMPQPKPKPEQMNDPLFPKTDPLLKKLNLSKEERAQIIAFLEAITTQPWVIQPPVLPK